MSDHDPRQNRPLSPHLQIWKPNLTMAMSILHRITGAALYFAMVLAAWWLVALASGPDYFAFVDGIFRSWFGLIVLFGASYALFHHAMGGIRHLVWDTGRAFAIPAAEHMAIMSLILAVAFTVILWLAGFVAS
ncbi:succinate dehydrogenase, cytochrome b556 subunit [Thermopetrobacter sp. TC1]|uniref:succinate dehydrogenase, cytochrome b556 subunit n=1 Tax=Thermopetrobacter sp. TC1 TaxID=1495045 RepID=UPI00056DA0EE|nr:succinate dehydrogenase, cytochrome b556 subunit [Thermopetrobacter sp. TC1]